MSSKLINMGRGLLNATPRKTYSPPSGKAAILSEILLTSNEQQAEVEIWVVPAGGAPEDRYRIQHAIALAVNENRYITLATVMETGDQLYLAATIGAPTFIASGVEVSNE